LPNLEGSTEAVQITFGFPFVRVGTLPYLDTQDKPDGELEASLDNPPSQLPLLNGNWIAAFAGKCYIYRDEHGC